MTEQKKGGYIPPPKKKICGICGLPITEKKTIDHIYPLALSKWCFTENADAVTAVINSRENKMPAHQHCNERKHTKIPKNIDPLHIPEAQKRALKKKAEILKPQIENYKRHKAEIFQAQDCRCYNCGRQFGVNNGIMRRIDQSKPRAWDNACVVCAECNNHNRQATWSLRQKRLDWEKQQKETASNRRGGKEQRG